MNVGEACISRREGLVWAGQWLGDSALVSVFGMPMRVSAAKVDKHEFFYQDKPKEGKSCSLCRLYSVNDLGKGQCAVVDGDVSPSGWCMAFSPRG
jgi:hypothetical protein